MRAKEVMQAALKATGLSQIKVASMVGMPEQSFGQKINVRETVKANEFFDILDKIGIETVFIVKATGKVLMKDTQYGERVVGMSDGVIYDTKESTLIATSFYGDGVNEFGPDGKAQELYVDNEGRYFVAEFTKGDTVKSRVRSVPVNMAEAFINQYGKNNKPV